MIPSWYWHIIVTIIFSGHVCAFKNELLNKFGECWEKYTHIMPMFNELMKFQIFSLLNYLLLSKGTTIYLYSEVKTTFNFDTVWHAGPKGNLLMGAPCENLPTAIIDHGAWSQLLKLKRIFLVFHWGIALKSEHYAKKLSGLFY